MEDVFRLKKNVKKRKLFPDIQLRADDFSSITIFDHTIENLVKYRPYKNIQTYEAIDILTITFKL